jgi:type VI secretion system ImpM family protein
LIYFGKIPTYNEFVRLNASGPPVRALQEWMQETVFLLTSRYRSNLDAAYEARSVFPFYFAPRSGGPALFGVLCPSRDGVGRSFPFFLGFEVAPTSSHTGRIIHAPVAYRAFVDQAAALVREAASGSLQPQDLPSRVALLSSPEESPEAGGALAGYLQEHRLEAFWERLWGHPEDARKYLLFKNLIDIALPLRGGVPPGYPLVLRFPISPGAQAHEYETSFWLEACIRLFQGNDITPSFFWTYPDPGGQTEPCVLVTLRSPAPRLFAYLVSADMDNDNLCVLEQMGRERAAMAALSIPSHYGAMLESDQLTMWDFLQRL